MKPSTSLRKAKEQVLLLSQLKKALLCVVLATSFYGCGQGENPTLVEVLRLIPLDEHTHPREAPRFELTAVDFHQRVDLNTLDGPQVTLTDAGRLDSKNTGTPPLLRFHTKNGVAVPADFETLMKFSAYYQFDEILKKLFAATGIPPEELTTCHGKIDLQFHPYVEAKTASEDIQGRGTLKTNASFNPTTFGFQLLPPSSQEAVPLAANLQVLAHEFGHLLFSHILEKNDLHNDPWFSSKAILGINEGWADLVSYVFTGSANILGASFPVERAKDRIFTDVTFSYSTLSSCTGDYYCLGTLFARSLYQTSLEGPSTFNERAALLREAVRRLKRVKEYISKEDKHLTGSGVSETALLSHFLWAFSEKDEYGGPGTIPKYKLHRAIHANFVGLPKATTEN